MPVMTGLSGNEMYCLQSKGLQAGNLVIGNSVYSVGFLGRVGSSFRTLAGGEVHQITTVIHDGRKQSYDRLVAEANKHGGFGITGISSELVLHGGNVEFLSIGSAVHRPGAEDKLTFSSSADGQELFCQIDAGFRPIKFVFGNVAYSIGVGGGVGGAFKRLKRGEVHQYSQVFNQTRHLAVERISAEAKAAGANAVVGIKTSILPFRGMQEMVMIGTASHHPSLPPQFSEKPVTSDLTNDELWNLANMGFLPIQLVLGVSVYSLGIAGGIAAGFRGLVRGEIEALTTLIYEARENALARIAKDATDCGADDVVGIKTYVYQLGSGLIEFMAIGTAVKRVEGARTGGTSLPTQAIIRDRTTFSNTAETALGMQLNQNGRSTASPEAKNAAMAANRPKSWWDYVKIILKILAKFG